MAGQQRATPEFRALFAARVNLVITENTLSHREWGEIIGCGASSVSMFRSGLRVPSLERASILADALGVSLDWLTGRTDERQPTGVDVDPEA